MKDKNKLRNDSNNLKSSKSKNFQFVKGKNKALKIPSNYGNRNEKCTTNLNNGVNKMKIDYDTAKLDNSDEEIDNYSVASGILDEEICWVCGHSTRNGDYSRILVCEQCSGDFHLDCVGLQKVPRISWTCRPCQIEIGSSTTLNYTVEDIRFRIPRRKCAKNAHMSICYNPSRPIDIAFEECKTKGIMLVKNFMPSDIMRILTHGMVTAQSASGRITDRWYGAVNEVSRRLSSNSNTIANIVDRNGRYDMTLPSFLIHQLHLEELLAPITTRLQSIMGKPTPKIRTHNIVFVPVGSAAQDWHYDDARRVHTGKYKYFTILVNLNTLDENCGGTEVRIRKDRKVLVDLIRGRPGDAFVFHGSLEHRGQANHGAMHRFFYYASFACKTDGNTENG